MVLGEVVLGPHTVVAVGHAATYAFYQAAYQTGTSERLVLNAPTWRGPFPTMTVGHCHWFDSVRTAVDNAVIGPLPSRPNVSMPVVRRMAQRDVYGPPAGLSGIAWGEELLVSRAAGAEPASVCIVADGLDRATAWTAGPIS